ncbi:unnamed protein product [Ambrosiozyma monospora]|uniref:Unnamed protein product n=1 Tax=Ambrosiozyma monospora TaxID=43982 RepID=A0ACB5TBD0_AMBMO|nr:unnamed protein product [Ambrosiozyma monospora]
MAKLRAKLSEKITTMKEKRRAPGSKVAGAATSREQILAERRKKQELRKETLKRKRDEYEEDDESSSDEEDDDEDEKTIIGSNVMFGNIEFADGERVTTDLSATRRVAKKKGPANKDIKGHLKKIELEKAKLQKLDKDAQQKHEEKSKWTRALSNVQGVKVKDDEKLLKKALKRKEAQKRKSGREWSDRKQFVADQIKAKAERREENLRIRKENKGKSKKQQQKQLKTFKRGVMAKPKRAGFEGRLKSGSKGKGGRGGKNGGKSHKK